MDFDPEDPLTSFQEHNSNSTSDLFAAETDHIPSENFFNRFKSRDFYVCFRNEAVALILQEQFSFNLDPFISYLAVNYIDLFVSKQEVPTGKPWLSKLVGIACLSLASKMKNSPFSLSDVQREEGFIFGSERIQKMELHILDTLNWRLRSPTPFSFICFFLSLVELKDPPLVQALKAQASKIIFNAHLEMKFVEFKPSIIAASAILSASHELLQKDEFFSLKASVSACQYVNNEKLTKCWNMMEEMKESESIMWQTVAMSSRTPMSVLDNDFTNSESDNKKLKFNI